jgi:hypothetical protein
MISNNVLGKADIFIKIYALFTKLLGNLGSQD